MASWLVNLPWGSEKPYDVLEFFAGVARVSRLAQLCGYNSRAFELEFDKPATGESRHSGRARRSAFDINGESGFVPLSYEEVINPYCFMNVNDRYIYIYVIVYFNYTSKNHLTHFAEAVNLDDIEWALWPPGCNSCGGMLHMEYSQPWNCFT